ncbi:hypothetical protein [Paenibacillus sp. FSL R5-0519]|uniref:hypothetical protein n=1 Tax=Paenibacillus sp. FSL R5-0519 TaxID=2921648 RepID=UPI0030DC4458
MKDKAKLTKEQAASLEDASKYNDIEKIVRIHMDVPVTKAWMRGSVHLNEISLDTLIRALYIGYEVEMTPEEKILEIYNIGYSRSGFGEENIAFREGIALALHTFGIKAEGVHTLPDKSE